jgi:hypothetical protein
MPACHQVVSAAAQLTGYCGEVFAQPRGRGVLLGVLQAAKVRAGVWDGAGTARLFPPPPPSTRSPAGLWHAIWSLGVIGAAAAPTRDAASRLPVPLSCFCRCFGGRPAHYRVS